MDFKRTEPPQFIVFMGPPGSGKTYLGCALARAFRVTFVEGERLLLEKYGSTENFVEHKEAALREYYAYLAELQLAKATVVAFESTGISDRADLLDLVAARDCAQVRVATPRSRCVERVMTRDTGRNFKAIDAGQFYDRWYAEVAPQYSFELVAENGDGATEETLAALAAALRLSALA
ncbi:MAG: AAA family ATPase [Deltaproteobacteria bacterium]